MLSVGGLATVVALFLSGCFTLNMDLVIQTDDTVDGSIVLAVDNSLAELAGGEDALVESLTSGDNALFSEQPSAGQVDTKTYTDGERTGVEYLLTGVPLSEFAAGTDSDISILRVDDTYVVKGSLDLSEGLDDSEPGTAELLETAEVSLSVTFPGEVLASNGEVSGNTVTWSPTAGEILQVEATGSSGPSTSTAIVAAVGLLTLFVVVSIAMWFGLRPR